MKEMTIEEAHEIALDIMKEIHDFCILNDIKYSLAYGSLIGAIRHKGFIPWDDDIDIWMTRENFEKFTRSFVSKRGYRLSSIYDDDSLINFDRVYETQNTFVKHGIKSCNGSTGIWVDIMPLDGVPDDEKLRRDQYESFSKMIGLMIEFRSWRKFVEHGGDLRKFLEISKIFLKNFFNGTLSLLTNLKACTIHQEMITTSTLYKFGETVNCCYFQCGDAYRKGKQELLPTQSFKDYKLTQFEDAELMIIENYDNILKMIYGDYMKLPPVSARHKSHGVCFWR